MIKHIFYKEDLDNTIVPTRVLSKVTTCEGFNVKNGYRQIIGISYDLKTGN